MAVLTLLAVDPGDCNAGWSVLSLREGLFSVIAYGVCQFKSEDDNLDKVEQFKREVWDRYKNLRWETLVIEDQPYLPKSGKRNFNLHQFQIGVETVAMCKETNVERVCPRTARKDLGICSGNYDLNKELSIKLVEQKLGMQNWEVAPKLFNHVADSIMIGWWFFSKKLGKTIIDPTDNDKSLNPVWIPPERWTKQSPPNRNVRDPSSIDITRSGQHPPEQRTYSTFKQVRRHKGRGSGGDRVDSVQK